MKRKQKGFLEENCVKRNKVSSSQSERWDRWESDSGFSSGRSSPLSGRSSPVREPTPVGTGEQALAASVDSLNSGPFQTSAAGSGPVQTSVVSLDCEMVGTGPGGRVSEVARCSVVDYHGQVLFDKYIRPLGRVTNFRSQWSGIRKHHLRQATPFSQARDQVQSLLEGKVLVGHSVQNDLKALDLSHPGHMIRDTSTSHLLTRLAGFHREHRPSLRALTNQLLHRKIQVGRCGHCPVEDAVAALDLYKLIEGEWERDVELSLRNEQEPVPPSYASSQHYMRDEYWPQDLF